MFFKGPVLLFWYPTFFAAGYYLQYRGVPRAGVVAAVSAILTVGVWIGVFMSQDEGAGPYEYGAGDMMLFALLNVPAVLASLGGVLLRRRDGRRGKADVNSVG